MERIEKCSQCHNEFDSTDLNEQEFDNQILKICSNCLDEIVTGERTIVI